MERRATYRIHIPALAPEGVSVFGSPLTLRPFDFARLNATQPDGAKQPETSVAHMHEDTDSHTTFLTPGAGTGNTNSQEPDDVEAGKWANFDPSKE